MTDVYTLPNCPQCKLTTKALDSSELPYRTLDAADPENMAFLKSLGYMQAPVVFNGGNHWSGFRPDLIKKIAA